MTHQGYAVDVGWLITQGNADFATVSRTFRAVTEMERCGLPFLMDHEGHIVAEYERCLPGESLGRKIYMHAIKANMISYYSGRGSVACRSCLDDAGFDPSDRPYVGVAQNGGGAYVTHESKHLEPSQVARIRAGSGVDILSTEGFFDDLAV